MESISKYLEALEDVLEESKPVPFSSRVSIDRDKIYEIINEVRLNMPNELRQSQKVILEQEKIIMDAKLQAEHILKDAKIEALRLIDEHEIYKQAIEEGSHIIEESKKNARDVRLNAMDYADEILAKTEEMVRETLKDLTRQNRVAEDFLSRTTDVLYNNRMELRGTKK